MIETAWLQFTAQELGFDLCGVASAADVATLDLGPRLSLNEWLKRGYAGEMGYLHDARRSDLASVMPEARSVIVCAINYDQPQTYSVQAAARAGDTPLGWISRYAWAEDYHIVLGEKLEELLAALRRRNGPGFVARAYVDTGPVSEKALATLAGLGWQGKNTCLINPELGSWLFLGVIITSLGCEKGTAAAPPADLCGNCRLCLDACPTGALVEPYVMDARRCISYLSIELRGSIPEELRSGMGWQVFGCDICQDVCPWNRAMAAPPQHSARKSAATARFAPRDGLIAPELEWLLGLSEDEFRERFRGSPVKRAKWRGLVRNACVAAGNALAKTRAGGQGHRTGDGTEVETRIRERLTELAASDDAMIAEHARWAISRWRGGGAQVVHVTGQD